ncbi:HORMA-domain-containing protein, partial [Hysterangium stoloniferum]
RGLLPDENFTEAHLTSSENTSFSQDTLHEDSFKCKRSTSSGAVKLKTIKKGWSTEGDKLLQYLEDGIFDALEKQYLRSFIFAVYLDEDDPQNIIEAYTFNFSYHTVAGTSCQIPVMTLSERLDKMAIHSRSSEKVDPVAAAVGKGKSPTLGEVKQSVKNLVRSLIAAIQTLSPLPRRRFATFKLFYRDNVPKEYEPPHFSSGNAEHKYIFTTRSSKEAPEKISIGSLSTPYHQLKMHVGSISDLIPQCGENDSAHFGALVANNERNTSRPIYDLTLTERDRLIDLQAEDALTRTVVWDAELSVQPEGLTDADGEDDRGFSDSGSIPTTQLPAGIRGDRTNVRLSHTNSNLSYTEYHGIAEPSPTHIWQKTKIPGESQLLPTQIILSTSAPKTPAADPELACATYAIPGSMGDSIVNFETQQPTKRNFKTPVMPAFSSLCDIPDQKLLPPPAEDPKAQDGHPHDESDDLVVDCDCGVHDDDHGACLCEGPCGRWLHVRLCRYHSTNDKRLPQVFRCFTCRLRNDPQIEVLDSRNLTSEYIAKFKNLSLFRRAIKIVEVHRPNCISEFKALLGSEVSTAGQTWKRLEAEGFIAPETVETESIGLLESREASRHKGKGKRKAKRNIKRAKYIPVPEAMASKAFEDYFDPTKEGVLLGLVRIRS